MTKTAEPGEIGNSGITGHRDTFFRHIYELEKGDQFFVERGGKRLVYEVTGKKIVEPTDMSVTRPTDDAQVTLITCYPTYYIGPAPKRLVVFSKLSNELDAAVTASVRLPTAFRAFAFMVRSIAPIISTSMPYFRARAICALSVATRATEHRHGASPSIRRVRAAKNFRSSDRSGSKSRSPVQPKLSSTRCWTASRPRGPIAL